VYRYALQNGVLLRPLGDVIYFMPPYVIMPEHISTMVEVAERGINMATQED
jgi:adenosylmethionine-8-amino-7-oxononanoate aminotransferase